MTYFNAVPPGAIQLALLLVALYLFLRLFMDVEVGMRRRRLQNLVYRGYRILEWLSAVWSSLDSGLTAYYRRREETKISPLSERQFKPTPVPAKPPNRGEEVLDHI